MDTTIYTEYLKIEVAAGRADPGWAWKCFGKTFKKLPVRLSVLPNLENVVVKLAWNGTGLKRA